MRGRVTILGSGTSHGVPMIGCTCGVCRSSDPRDRRTRPSIVVEVEDGPAILVDTSTDLRHQALAHGVTRVDAILFTHSHADHIMGLDDVRRFNVMQQVAIPAYADERTAIDLRRSFSYVFNPPAEKGGGVPQVSLTAITGRFNVGPTGIQPVPIFHGSRPILGFRFGSFAYLTDCSRIADEAWPLLQDLDILVLDALRHRPHPTHFTVAEALDVVERVRPRQTYFTHICHDLPHEATNASLPPAVELAYDGLVLTIEAAPQWT
ncbi:MAG TPA: MBL fold metallo-hydrolase [Vicinamibacterales bacterium]|nr:MBL fold metallo-hydrolase [Vicinamibacterales bacterium]